MVLGNALHVLNVIEFALGANRLALQNCLNTAPRHKRALCAHARPSFPRMEAVVIRGFFAVLTWLFGFGRERSGAALGPPPSH